ncbi:alpha/beta hydrolase [Verrucomicrobiales bacterium]|jgi:acetyl esterase|nr:alpha/beta hydrolase [Verrucomicrobiales bacterium]
MIRFLLTAFLLTATTPLFAKFDYPPKMQGAETIAYKTIGDVTMNLHVFKPEGWKAEDSRPVAVFFFGGGWAAGSPEQFEAHCKHLAMRGMVAITADYRVSSRHGTKAKSCLNDARDAIRFVRTHAEELGIDPNHVAAGGGSAGGHLAAALGTVSDDEEKVSSRPNLMLLFNPACVLAPYEGKQPWPEDRADEFLEKMGVDPVEMSPIHHVSSETPPAIIFHGTADEAVPFATSEQFATTVKKAGMRCDLKAYDSQPHGFFNFGRNDNVEFYQTLNAMDAFLVDLNWLPENPN